MEDLKKKPNKITEKGVTSTLRTSEEVHRAIDSLPQMSVGGLRVLNLIAEKDHSLQDIVASVENDAVLTTNLLKIVNSPVYGLMEPAETLSRAIAYLGERMVVCLVLKNSIGPLMQQPLAGYCGISGELWKHNLRTAIASREVAKLHQDICHPDIAFTGGLIHDIGKMVLSEFIAREQESIVEHLDNEEYYDFLEREVSCAEFNHSQVGSELALKWNLPEVLQMVILHHHAPRQAPQDMQPLVYAVHLGDVIAMMGGFGTGIDNLQYRLDNEYTQYLNLSYDQLVMIMSEVEEEFGRVVAAMER